MQGRSGEEIDGPAALGLLGEALDELGEHARQYSVPLLFEPINRYETNLITSITAGLDLIAALSTPNVKLLADLFHMNIEEVDVAKSLESCGPHLGHLHFVDSNRRPAGLGHLDYRPIAAVLCASATAATLRPRRCRIPTPTRPPGKRSIPSGAASALPNQAPIRIPFRCSDTC